MRMEHKKDKAEAGGSHLIKDLKRLFQENVITMVPLYHGFLNFMTK